MVTVFCTFARLASFVTKIKCVKWKSHKLLVQPSPGVAGADGCFKGFMVQSWHLEILGKVLRWRWAVTVNVCPSRKCKDNQEANLLLLRSLLPSLWLLMNVQQPQWHFTQFNPCPIMHLGIPWHLAAMLYFLFFLSVSAAVMTSTTSILLTVTHHKWVYQHTSNRHTPQGP